MKTWDCAICGGNLDGVCYHAEPLAKGLCCVSCHTKVLFAHASVNRWAKVVGRNLYQSHDINQAFNQECKFAKQVIKCTGKYMRMDWGDVCTGDSKMNDHAVYLGGDRVVAKYKTNKGDIFIITEQDRSATTVMFAHEN